MRKLLAIKMASVVLAIIFFSTSAFAQAQATKTRTDRGWSHLMCAAETTNGICDSGSEDIYAWVGNYSSFTVYFEETGGVTATCEVHAAGIGVSMATDMNGFSENKINSTSLSDSQDAITFSGGDFEYVWVKCASISTTVTVTLQGSVGLHRTKR